MNGFSIVETYISTSCFFSFYFRKFITNDYYTLTTITTISNNIIGTTGSTATTT